MTDVKSCSVQEFRKWLSRRLIVDRALEPTDELYEPWYDVHPLIRDEVGEILRRDQREETS